MEQAITRTLYALSDPTRRAIIRMLQDRDMTAGEIAAHFAISAPSISHHLNVLKAAELVTAERHGQRIVYRVNATVLQEVIHSLMEVLRIGIERKGDGHA
ncbi:autorepressor SdpR family transcription factor [Chloroflexus sp. Y-396-1]|jgi:ArsR family transcriptional regulator|uniref:autorepressor SdpR family transcription factor n=1 Tax=Chloroflexus sp. Y-396-1 TaxID=867845 RepID=UPI0004AF6EE0|nr:autorepressor SdpR family transcription factor [Chloroflexus sp. Y-396-1]